MLKISVFPLQKYDIAFSLFHIYYLLSVTLCKFSLKVNSQLLFKRVGHPSPTPFMSHSALGIHPIFFEFLTLLFKSITVWSFSYTETSIDQLVFCFMQFPTKQTQTNKSIKYVATPIGKKSQDLACGQLGAQGSSLGHCTAT